MNVLALCAGYGGLELGLHLATSGEARCVCYVEREASSAAVLVKEMEAARLAPAPIWSDLATFDARAWRGVVDCVTAGFPCQPASVAGTRKGTADARWLWPMVARVIQDTEAPLVFLENVPGLRTKGMSHVLEDLAAMGFDAEWGCLRAAALGAPQGRDRLWLLAYTSSPGRAKRDGPRRLPAEVAEPATAGRRLGHTNSKRQRQQGGTKRAQRGRARDTSPQPWPPGPEATEWPANEPKPAIRRKAHGDPMPLGLSLRMLGNGVVPVVAAYAFRALVGRALRGHE